MAKKHEPSKRAAGIPQRADRRKRHGPGFPGTPGDITPVQKPRSQVASITKVLALIKTASEEFGNFANGKGPNLTPPLNEFRNRKPKYRKK